MIKDNAKLIALVSFIVAVVCLYFFTPLSQYMQVDKLSETLKEMPKSWGIFFAFLAAFAIGGVIMAPIPLLAFSTSLVFGIWQGIGITFLGVILASSSGYLLGYLLNAETFGSFVEKHLSKFKDTVGDQGAWAVLGLRVAPTPPFTITSILSGSISLHFPKYLLGSIVGIAPLSLSAIFFGKSALEMMKNPSGLASTGLIAAAILFGVYFLAKQRVSKNT